jgi:hypothetical protein
MADYVVAGRHGGGREGRGDGRTKKIFLKESKVGHKCVFTGFGNLQNERLR